MHITSLPSAFGIGDLGPGAYKFVDFLAQSHQKYWQVLPLNVTDAMYGNSPYSSISAFAGDPVLISPEGLVERGWLKKTELKSQFQFEKHRVNYQEVRKYKAMLFDMAFKRFYKDRDKSQDYLAFCNEQAHWLDDFSLFVVLKELHPEGTWNQWDREIQMREVNALDRLFKEHDKKIHKIKFLQFVFWQQWMALKEYCHAKGISLVGDIPIYVNFDSVDVWAHPEFYKLDDQLNPVYVSGVPPDYFSKTGQRWGDPVYDWDKLREFNYGWWIDRMKHNLQLFDLVRIDHFRGLIAFWQIPAEERTAINGDWCAVPWQDFFAKILQYIPRESVIAEDLGLITDDVKHAMRELGFPGMKVLLFAFNGDMETHPYLPHNYDENTIVYTGTHDNNTAVGWFKEDATQQEKDNLFNYTQQKYTAKDIHWGLIKIAMDSRANLAMVPLQDVLGLGGDCKMNQPSTLSDANWSWRVGSDALTRPVAEKLKTHTSQSGR
jgi:4-alpha-glucanotransferase